MISRDMENSAPQTSTLELAILESLQNQGEPMGCGSLHYLLRKRGSNLSAPTIGRKLRELEHRGLVAKVSVEGRKLTPAGERMLRKLDHDRRLQTSGENVLRAVKRTGKKDIVDQLVARRVIEGETAALAAANISDAEVDELEGIIRQQREQVERGESGVPQDMSFHERIAAVSGNSVLAAMVAMLRSQDRLNYIVTAIRTHVGSRLVVDHYRIVEGLRARDPDAAREAMQQHISRVIGDVERYWEQVFPQRGGD
jgi:GntR family L-lactate dehydrogenase operon transcriptional regulator